ncbi:GlxA family transcriptional regulator, partial [Pseudomonas aeruginosa]
HVAVAGHLAVAGDLGEGGAVLGMDAAAVAIQQAGVALAGLWNGAWFLGDAGLLDGYRCCIHPEHRAALAEIARNSQVTSDSYMVDSDRLTAASPTGAFNLALEWIARRSGRDLVEAVVDNLAFEESR